MHSAEDMKDHLRKFKCFERTGLVRRVRVRGCESFVSKSHFIRELLSWVTDRPACTVIGELYNH